MKALLVALLPLSAAAADITPDTACGAPGVGIGAHGQTLEMARPGMRVDEGGRWVQCDRPCVPPSGATNALRTWSVGNNRCTSADRAATNTTHPARDQVLKHGAFGTWKQWMGPMRGQLVEWCDDGTRTVVAATCAPATQCDYAIRFDRAVYEGGRQVRRTYIYDARPAAARVPIGATVDAVAADGARWPVTCKAGDLVAPQELPSPVAPAASRPAPVALPGCGPQTLTRGGLTTVYSGPRVDEGRTVIVRLGLRYMPAWCRDGRLSLDPPTVTPETAASSAEAWRSGIR